MKILQTLNILGALFLLQIAPSGTTKALNEGREANFSLSLAEKFRILLSSVAAENAIHLLETGILGLREEEIDPEDTDQEEAGEENVCTPLPSLEHGRHEEGNSEVVDPVARRAN